MSINLTTVVIPAAGLGTRLLPLTKSVPKELLPIYDRPAIQFALDEAVEAGARHIIVVIGPDKAALQTYLETHDELAMMLEAKGKYELLECLRSCGAPAGVKVSVVVQSEPKGLGHAIHCCAPGLGREPFGVILPDDVIFGTSALADLAQSYEGGHMVAAQLVDADEVSSYGIFRPETSMASMSSAGAIRVAGMVEKPAIGTAPSRLAAVGRYILDPAVLGRLAMSRPGAGGEIQLTDAIAADAGFMPLYAYRLQGVRFDCGSHEGLLAASLARRDIVAAAQRDLLVAE